MNGQEIFNEILKSPKLKERLGIPEQQDLSENLESASSYPEVAVIQNIINGQLQHNSEDNIFKNIRRLYNL